MRAGARSLSESRARAGAVLVSPAVVLIVTAALLPLLRTFLLSVSDARLDAPGTSRFIGLQNFALLARDPLFWDAAGHTALFTIASVSLETCLGLALALVLHGRFRGRGWMRAAALIPWAIPTVVSAQLWKFMLNDAYGVVNDLGLRLGLLNEPVAWLAAPGLAMASVVAVDVWKTTPFVALLVLAGLQTVPVELHEAAQVDGAGRWERFRRVTLPLILPTLLVAMLFRTMDAIRVFDVIYVMTLGSVGTESMATYCRRLLVDFQDLGYGSACSVAIFLLVGSVSAVYAVLLARRERAR